MCTYKLLGEFRRDKVFYRIDPRIAKIDTNFYKDLIGEFYPGSTKVSLWEGKTEAVNNGPISPTRRKS